ncbi:hypothetical protein KI387_031021 [Taxus chinensis]|uniref:Uncharacterized protein n=1 Tax=Taxus chinensis TaxID=29808 RepID=A0AA38CMR0_TAXCH|nr:hypothetical protein KI387_031021 [Taxus chinensis]
MGVVCVVDFQVMKNGTVAYPMFLGRPWLRRVHVRNYWNEGFMTLGRGRERVKINVIPRHHKEEPVDSSDETDDWTSSDYSSTSKVDTEDEESEVDVSVMDILPVTPTHEPIKLSEEKIDDRLQQINIGDAVMESEKECYL